ncbi:MAG: glycosyltransferase [bacterium]|nr:glycosyltransferase [bacterium]
MKILLVNKFYYPNRGADKYFLYLEKLLRSKGHEVRVFAMSSALNLPSADSNFFSEHVNLHATKLLDQLSVASKIIYNREAKRQFSRLLIDFKPDLIHCHNIYHQLSPSILEAAKSAKVPVTMHLHDYKLICPNYKLYAQGQECRRCQKQKYWQCIAHRCVENSSGKSAVAAIEMYVHHTIKHIYRDKVKLFIAPSRFMRDVCVEFGWHKEQFRILENIGSISNATPTNTYGDYFLYFGALEEEKGIDTLLRAAALSRAKIVIAGEGKAEENLKQLATELGVNVKFTGKLGGSQLQQTIDESRAVVIPSRWPENMPLAGIEAMMSGKAVIAAKIGGLQELVVDGDDGLLFTANNHQELSACLDKLDEDAARRMGQKARESRLSKDENWHYEQLIKIYEETLNVKRK